jgi:aminoglycoside phosphotransferase (APT) family kinase protein
MRRLADTTADLPGPYALLHSDTRSDNLRFTGGRLSLFDWPSIEVGRPEFDVVAFAQSIAVEGGPGSEQFVSQPGFPSLPRRNWLVKPAWIRDQS